MGTSSLGPPPYNLRSGMPHLQTQTQTKRKRKRFRNAASKVKTFRRTYISSKPEAPGKEGAPRNHPEISSQKVANFECRFPYDCYGRDTAPFWPFLGAGFWGNIQRPLVLPAGPAPFFCLLVIYSQRSSWEVAGWAQTPVCPESAPRVLPECQKGVPDTPEPGVGTPRGTLPRTPSGTPPAHLGPKDPRDPCGSSPGSQRYGKNSARREGFQGRKRNPNPNFLVWIFSGGVGVFHMNG